MMPEISLLSYILPKYVIQAENAVTDCLFFILTTYRAAFVAFIRYLSQVGLALPEDLELNTQVSWEHEGRPDMVGLKDNERVLLIEAKFAAPLTKNQPIGYLRQLAPRMNGVLLFIAPTARVADLWDELRKHCSSLRTDINIGRRVSENGLIASPVSNKQSLAVTSWDSMIDYLEAVLQGKQDQQAINDLLQFRSLCNRLSTGNLDSSPLLAATASGDKRDRQGRKMVDSITRVLIEKGHAKTKGYRATPGPGYYKRYMTLSGQSNWCVEFNLEYWARFGESPIWLTITIEPELAALLEMLETSFSGLTRRYTNQFIVPLRPAYIRSEAEALDHMTKQAISFARAVAASST
jgi:hypothetical protein